MNANRRREQGIILFVAVLMLALMGALAISSLDTASRDREAAGYYNRSNTALFAAEAGVSAAKALIKQNPANCPGTIVFNTQATPVYIGDTATWSAFGGLPKYYGDPAVVDAIECVQLRKKNGSSMSVAGPKETIADWRIYVIGESPDGSVSRLEVMHEETIYK